MTVREEKEKCQRRETAYSFVLYFTKEVILYLTPFEEIVCGFDGKRYFTSCSEALDFVREYCTDSIAAEIDKITLCPEKEALIRAKKLEERVKYEQVYIKKRFRSGVLEKSVIPAFVYVCAVLLTL